MVAHSKADIELKYSVPSNPPTWQHHRVRRYNTSQWAFEQKRGTKYLLCVTFWCYEYLISNLKLYLRCLLKDKRRANKRSSSAQDFAVGR
jgi:hypothetical protein